MSIELQEYFHIVTRNNNHTDKIQKLRAYVDYFLSHYRENDDDDDEVYVDTRDLFISDLQDRIDNQCLDTIYAEYVLSII